MGTGKKLKFNQPVNRVPIRKNIPRESYDQALFSDLVTETSKMGEVELKMGEGSGEDGLHRRRRRAISSRRQTLCHQTLCHPDRRDTPDTHRLIGENIGAHIRVSPHLSPPSTNQPTNHTSGKEKKRGESGADRGGD